MAPARPHSQHTKVIPQPSPVRNLLLIPSLPAASITAQLSAEGSQVPAALAQSLDYLLNLSGSHGGFSFKPMEMEATHHLDSQAVISGVAPEVTRSGFEVMWVKDVKRGVGIEKIVQDCGFFFKKNVKFE